MHLNEKEYLNQFTGKKRKKALERAWKNRDFEIQLYWKRATYFWTFLVATFAGYFIVISRPEVSEAFPQAELVVTSLGLVFSLAWHFVNKGSKKWQENWEHHIDMLEEKVTGNIYKTVLDKTGFSVSGINLKVSMFVFVIWLFLTANYFLKSYGWAVDQHNFDWVELIISLFTLGFTIALFRERKKARSEPIKDKNGTPQISFSLRKFKYQNRPSAQNKDK